MIPVIDLFAGPGGLNEGFSSVGESDKNPVFHTVASFEMDEFAHQTLLLRHIFRAMMRGSGVTSSYYDFINGSIEWGEFVGHPAVAPLLSEAQQAIHKIELGPENRTEADNLIRAALLGARSHSNGHWVLIGGPPCQAYSLAGRSRRVNDTEFANDKKHFLYREYLHIIENFAPSIFVMENVKGLLSSTHAGTRMFDLILNDLSHPKDGLEYEIRSLVVPGSPEELDPKDFIVRAEDYGVPQRRHRVILVGVRSDLLERATTRVLVPEPQVTVRDAIADLPKIRSAIAPPRDDSNSGWNAARSQMYGVVRQTDTVRRPLGRPRQLGTGGIHIDSYVRTRGTSTFSGWIDDPSLPGITLHEARRHMRTDLLRYGYLACRALNLKKNPTMLDLPDQLQPAHKNIGTADTPFTDRFRVQLWDTPATTIVSHIAKDGHYYIHPDPEQMRSLTVREAARLQSFPDNYFFRGTRTQQYSQVGNAVPPLLASKIGTIVAELLAGIDRDDDEQVEMRNTEFR